MVHLSELSLLWLVVCTWKRYSYPSYLYTKTYYVFDGYSKSWSSLCISIHQTVQDTMHNTSDFLHKLQGRLLKEVKDICSYILSYQSFVASKLAWCTLSRQHVKSYLHINTKERTAMAAICWHPSYLSISQCVISTQIWIHVTGLFHKYRLHKLSTVLVINLG